MKHERQTNTKQEFVDIALDQNYRWVMIEEVHFVMCEELMALREIVEKV